MLNLSDKPAVWTHPKLGASWEGFALESVIRHLKVSREECYFWATQAHAELDLLIVQGTVRRGFEFKYSLTPELTKSMQIAMTDLGLESLTVIYPGDKRFPLAKNIMAMGLEGFLNQKKP